VAKEIVEEISPGVVTDNSVMLIMDAVRMLGDYEQLLEALENKIKHDHYLKDLNDPSFNFRVPIIAKILEDVF
jgi:hypothetical protein